MHVVSASRRTDIPAFHAEWFLNRIRSGSVRVVAPFGGRVQDVSLAADDVTAIVFWTKNAAPLMPWLEELRQRGYCFTFLYTINNYPRFMEPNVPDCAHTRNVLENITRAFPNAMIRWRYDTIVLTEELNRDWHMKNFSRLCDMLAPFTKECIFSFCDYYKKTVRNMDRRVPAYKQPTEPECKEMAEEMALMAKERGIVLTSCAHDFLVSPVVGKAACIDPKILAKVVDSPERLRAVTELKKAPSRKECGCFASRDIGAYDTCAHGCVYCYANSDPARVQRNRTLITPESLCLHPL